MGHPAQVDEHGYVIRRSVLEEGTRPEYIIPVGSANGVWGMIKRVGRFRGEGWLALWKGIATYLNDPVADSKVFQDCLLHVSRKFFQRPSSPSFTTFSSLYSFPQHLFSNSLPSYSRLLLI